VLSTVLKSTIKLPNHSQIPFAASHSSIENTQGFTGPRDPPPPKIGKVIAGLRRLNSDAKNNRYFRFGRQASPTLELGLSRHGSWTSISAAIGVSGSRDSMASLYEIDRVLEEKIRGLEETGEDDESMEAFNLECADDVAREDSETLPEERAETVDVPTAENLVSGQGRKRKSNVWDDGEQFWSQQPQVREDMTDLVPLATTNNSQNRSGGDIGKIWPQRISQMRKSAVLESAAMVSVTTPQTMVLLPSSHKGTPASLYDENGFLKN
jgi:hypothetical protein